MIIHDITLPLSEDLPVWPGDPSISITRLGEADEQISVSRLCMSSHAGTHVDPPAHFFPGGATVDQLPLDVLLGTVWVTHLPGAGPLTARALEEAAIPAGTVRLLIRTENSSRPPGAGFTPRFVALESSAARWLLERGIRLVGIDGPSIEAFEAPGEPVHRALLSAGVVIVEGLVLAGIEPAGYELACMPLRIAGGDGGPARALLLAPPAQQGVIR